MSKVFALSSLVLLMAFSALGDCPTVYSVDDPPCTPCPFEYVGSYVGIQSFADGSFWTVEGSQYRNCEDVSEYIPGLVLSYGGCPSPSSSPCAARDTLIPPS